MKGSLIQSKVCVSVWGESISGLLKRGPGTTGGHSWAGILLGNRSGKGG